MRIPRPEHPRPQFVRSAWQSLNGPWQFEMDPGDSGLERGLLNRDLHGRITVPFCPESPLSGVDCQDFVAAVWYRRALRLPREWKGRRVLLHFQAVDYDATVWVNGVEVARHRGGFTPFSCDITAQAAAGQTATIVVRARDDHRQPKPQGKQSAAYANHGCLYTRTTGIWQTVWLEAVPTTWLGRARITPDTAAGAFHITAPVHGPRAGLWLRAKLADGSRAVAEARVPADADFAPRLTLSAGEKPRLWSPKDPHLYGLTLELCDGRGAVVDRVESYAGLRGVRIEGRAILLNGKPVFQRLVLDQGYYPDGIMTAPSDADLKRDIELSVAAGFNGARLHQKVFEERFLYHADRQGYLVWGEFGDWGGRLQPDAAYPAQWLEALERDYSHPSIIGWCPLNETRQDLGDRFTALDDATRAMFLATKALDLTRPVLDASGYSHRVPETDVYDCHDYEQDVEKFRANQAGAAEGRPFINPPQGKPWSLPYGGQPFLVSEFGGIWWNPDARPGEDSWGYGQRPKTIEEFYARFDGLCGVLLANPGIAGYCYTQLTDVYQEQNGIYTFDRKRKFGLAHLRAAQQRPAAIEGAGAGGQ